MDRYEWLALAGLGWAVLVAMCTAIYAKWTFARRGWTQSVMTRAFDRIQRTQSSFEAISQAPVRMPEHPAAVLREPEPVAPAGSSEWDPVPTAVPIDRPVEELVVVLPDPAATETEESAAAVAAVAAPTPATGPEPAPPEQEPEPLPAA